MVDAAIEPGVFGAAAGDALAYAWAFSWDGYFSARTLNRLQRAGAKARAATRAFTAETPNGPHAFEPGAIVVPVGRAAEPGANAEIDLEAILAEAAAADGVDVHRLIGGQAAEGIDLGSPSLRPLTPPRPLLVTGRGVPSYRVGEAWHLLDERFGVEASLVDLGALGSMDLDRYTHVVLALGGRPLRRRGEGRRATRAVTVSAPGCVPAAHWWQSAARVAGRARRSSGANLAARREKRAPASTRSRYAAATPTTATSGPSNSWPARSSASSSI